TWMQQVRYEEAKSLMKGQILELLRKEVEKCASFIACVSEEFLGQVITMPPGGAPPSRNRFDMIASVKEHEMHHRGQLMLIERMIGIVPHLSRLMQDRMAQAQQRS